MQVNFFFNIMQQYESKTDRNLTPLHVAAQCNNTEVSQLLLQRNGDIEARYKYNQTPHQLPILSNSNKMFQLHLVDNAANEARRDNITSTCF